jgi:hypothetical protein
MMNKNKWSCVTCTFLNDQSFVSCEMCQAPRPRPKSRRLVANGQNTRIPKATTLVSYSLKGDKESTSDIPKSKLESSNKPWSCIACTFENDGKLTECEMCAEKRDGHGFGFRTQNSDEIMDMTENKLQDHDDKESEMDLFEEGLSVTAGIDVGIKVAKDRNSRNMEKESSKRRIVDDSDDDDHDDYKHTKTKIVTKRETKRRRDRLSMDDNDGSDEDIWNSGDDFSAPSPVKALSSSSKLKLKTQHIQYGCIDLTAVPSPNQKCNSENENDNDDDDDDNNDFVEAIEVHRLNKERRNMGRDIIKTSMSHLYTEINDNEYVLSGDDISDNSFDDQNEINDSYPEFPHFNCVRDLRRNKECCIDFNLFQIDGGKEKYEARRDKRDIRDAKIVKKKSKSHNKKSSGHKGKKKWGWSKKKI